MTAYIVAELDKLNSEGKTPMMIIYVDNLKLAEIHYRLIVFEPSNNLLIAEKKNVNFMSLIK